MNQDKDIQKDELLVYEIEMYKNIGTIENPIMRWVKDKRYYRREKQLTDFDLHDVNGLRRNAKFIGVVLSIPPTKEASQE